MSEIKAGVVAMTEFCSPQSSAFTGYINYIDRDEAVRIENAEKYDLFEQYQEYMADGEKTTGLFTEKEDELSLSGKKEIKEMFKQAQDNGSLMWQTVYSFDTRWLSDMGIYDPDTGHLDDKRIKTAARAAVSKMLEKEGLTESVWSGAIHYNTDNFHIHIAITEPHPKRAKKEYIQYEKEKINGKWQYKREYNEKSGKMEKVPLKDANDNIIRKEEYIGRLKESSIKAGKSELVKELSDMKEINKEINALIRDRILKDKRENSLLHNDAFREKLLDIYERLPRNVNRNLWSYNASAMAALRAEIDDLSDLYIQTYHKDDFESLKSIIKRQDKLYQTAYGGENTFSENKIKDLYARLGNSILSELKVFDRKKEAAPAQVSDEMESDEPGYESATDEKAESVMDEVLDGMMAENIHYEWSYEYKRAKKLIFKDKDYEKAYALLESEAKSGNVLAIYDLGDMYQYGRGVTQDKDKADLYYAQALAAFVKVYESSDEKAKIYISYRIGKMYNYGLGAEKNEEEAIKWLKYSADNGNRFAQYTLGTIFYEKKEYEKAIYLFGMAANQENPYAQYKLGKMYSLGEGMETDTDLAYGYYSAALNNFLATYNKKDEVADDNLIYKIGLMHLKGEGTEKDIKKAVEYFEESVNLGNTYAKYRLAMVFLKEPELFPDRLPEAVSFLEKTAVKNNDALAQYALGKIYLDEKYNMYDMDKGIMFLKKSAENGSGYAAYRLGKVYLMECRDEENAMKYLKIAECHDNEAASYAIAKMLTDPASQFFDPEEGLKKMNDLVENGNEHAAVSMGMIYYKGTAATKDNMLAKKYFTVAADKGNSFAAEMLDVVKNAEKHKISSVLSKYTNLNRKNVYDLARAMRYLRRSLERDYDSWRNQQDFYELQAKISHETDNTLS